jgi:hypothetical protein
MINIIKIITKLLLYSDEITDSHIIRIRGTSCKKRIKSTIEVSKKKKCNA